MPQNLQKVINSSQNSKPILKGGFLDRDGKGS